MDHDLLKLTDISFPLNVIEHKKCVNGALFSSHLHENQLQLFYFIHGNAKIFCNQNIFETTSSDILLINKNELHYGENEFGELHYFVFRIDLKLLTSYQISAITEKYIEPLSNGLLVLQNKVTGTQIQCILDTIIKVYRTQDHGYELQLVSCLFDLLRELVANYKGRIYNERSVDILMKKTRRFADIFHYIESNYAQNITLAELAHRAHMSEGYFCRMFKQSTGRTPMDYINHFRIEQSIILLNQGICNITEAGMTVGFDDINYFSRVFKKYMQQSPEHYLKNDNKYFL